MSETWVFNTKDSDACIDFAAKGLDEGWLVSVYRVPDDDKGLLRADADRRMTKADVYDQET